MATTAQLTGIIANGDLQTFAPYESSPLVVMSTANISGNTEFFSGPYYRLC